MRKIILLYLFSYLHVGFAQYTKLPLTSVTQKQKEVANQIIDLAFVNCNKYIEEGLPSKIATKYFRDFYKTAKVVSICNKANTQTGKINFLELTEYATKNEKHYLRYKVKRENETWFTEIRVVLNNKNKIIGLTTKDFWSDKIYNFKERLQEIKVPKANINDSIINIQLEIINNSFTKCTPKAVFNDTIEKSINISVKNKWQENALKNCKKVQDREGAIQSIAFAEQYTDTIAWNRYRYKTQFSKLKKPSEIRVYTRLDNSIIGIWVIPVWYDTYIGLKKAIEKSNNELGF